MDIQKLLRKGIEEISPYVAGKTPEEIKKEYNLDESFRLSANENPLGPSPVAIKAIIDNISSIFLYPDGEAKELRSILAQKLKISDRNIILGNGGDEIISMAARAFIEREDECIIPKPSFEPYETAVKIMGGKIKESPLRNFHIDLADIEKHITSRTKIIFLCSPHNPTGTIIKKPELERFLRNTENIIIILDEAYRDFADDQDFPDGLSYIDRFANLLIIRTFSKIYGLAGLRIGYGIAHPEMIQYLNRVREPFNVNRLAQIAATAALNDDSHYNQTISHIKKERLFIYEELSKRNLKYVPSQSNFIFINIGEKCPEFQKYLLTMGIIVRAGKSFGLPEYIRVSVGTRKQNINFFRVLDEFFS